MITIAYITGRKVFHFILGDHITLESENTIILGKKIYVNIRVFVSALPILLTVDTRIEFMDDKQNVSHIEKVNIGTLFPNT